MRILRRIVLIGCLVGPVLIAGAARGDLSAGRSCVGLSPPSDGYISADFAPGPGYKGHWGIDYQGDRDGLVHAAAAGRVVFAGQVTDNLTVTIDHGGGLRTSYSYLETLTVHQGQQVGRGSVIAVIGSHPEHDGLHFSVRLDGTYLDPEPILGCLARPPSAGLRVTGVW